MEEEALTWYQWMHSNYQLLSWPMFLNALELRFAPSHFDDPRGTLFKLCQTTTFKDYQTAFETLANRISGFPNQFFLSCFIYGLKPAICREVQAFQPTSLSHAISLAHLQEDKLNDRSSFIPNRRPKNPTLNTPITTNTHRPNTTTRPALTIVPNTTTPTNNPCPTPTIRRLSLAELQARRDRGLCYNCDEIYHNGHRFCCLFHLLIVEPDDPIREEDNGSQFLLEQLM